MPILIGDNSSYDKEYGIGNNSTYNTLYNRVHVSFKNNLESLNFLFSGLMEPDSLGAITHEYTHFWYTLSPLYDCINELKSRAIGDYFKFIGNASGDIKIPWGVASKNYYLWKYAEIIEHMINPIMEGTSYFSEFDSTFFPASPAEFKTLPDLLKEKLIRTNNIVYSNLNTSDNVLKGLISVPEFIKSISSDEEGYLKFYYASMLTASEMSGERKAALFMQMPFLITKSMGGHQLGYLYIKGLYHTMLNRLIKDDDVCKQFTPSFFLHYIRQKIFFNKDIIDLIYERSNFTLESFEQLHEMIWKIIRLFHSVLQSFFMNTEMLIEEVTAMISTLKTCGYSLGCPIKGYGFRTEIEYIAYNRLKETIFSCNAEHHSGVSLFLQGNFLRKTAVKFNSHRAYIKNSEGGLLIIAQLEDNSIYCTKADQYPLEDFACKDGEEIDIHNLLLFDGKELKFYNAFKLHGKSYMCTAGFGEQGEVIDEDYATMILEHLQQEPYVYTIIDSVSELCDKCFPEEDKIRKEMFDAFWTKKISDMYLDPITSESPFGLLYLNDNATSENKWKEKYPDSFYKPNTLYNEFAKDYFSPKEFRDFIISTVKIGRGKSTKQLLNQKNIAKWWNIHDKINEKNSLGLFITIQDEIYSIL